MAETNDPKVTYWNINRRFPVDSLTLLFHYLALVAASIAAIILTFWFLGKGGPYKFLAMIWAGGFLCSVYNYLKMPYLIVLKQWNVIVFVSLLSEKEVFMPDIVQIQARPSSFFILFKIADSNIRMLNNIERIRELIIEIRKNHCNLVTLGF